MFLSLIVRRNRALFILLLLPRSRPPALSTVRSQSGNLRPRPDPDRPKAFLALIRQNPTQFSILCIDFVTFDLRKPRSFQPDSIQGYSLDSYLAETSGLAGNGLPLGPNLDGNGESRGRGGGKKMLRCTAVNCCLSSSRGDADREGLFRHSQHLLFSPTSLVLGQVRR